MVSSRNNCRHVAKHKNYKHVYEYVNTKTGEVIWFARMRNPKTGSQNGKHYPTDKEAAKAVDMFLINIGMEPVNILKKK